MNRVSRRPTQGLVSSADPLLGRGPRKAWPAPKTLGGVFAVAYSGFFVAHDHWDSPRLEPLSLPLAHQPTEDSVPVGE